LPGSEARLVEPPHMRVARGKKSRTPNTTGFRIGNDGKLTFVRKYDIDVGDKTMFWMGIVPVDNAG